MDQLKDAFQQLDAAQRGATDQVDSYRLYLPERARTSGVLPRFQMINGEAEALVGEYLDVLDRFPIQPRMPPEHLQAARTAYRHVEPRLRTAASGLEQFVLDYENELARVGAETRRIEQLHTDAADALAEATTAWESLRTQGLESSEADHALAEARVVARKLTAWEMGQGLAVLDAVVERVRDRAADVVRIAQDWPERVRRVRTRGVTLRTKLESIETRRGAMTAALGMLRREFSLGNWDDLEGSERRVTEGLLAVRAPLSRLDAAVRAQSWDEAVTQLVEVEAEIDRLDDLVDGPHDRLDRLRRFRADPEKEIARTRFALRDAQLLVTTSRRAGREDLARDLDRLAFRLDGVRELLNGAHPDYWSVVLELERVRSGVEELVRRFRSAR